MNATNRDTNAGSATTGDGVRRGTGRDRPEWFALLDAWGAAGRPYREIADWLTGEHGLSNWWAQKLIVEYEQARGIRPPGVRRDGTFEVGASKTVAVPGAGAARAFLDADLRERWLPGADMHVTTPPTSDTLRFNWEGGSSRVVVTLVESGAKTQVAVQHQRLPDAASAELMKAFWRERLSNLKDLLEA